MKLKIGERRHLLAKILNRSNGIEAVQGALERQVGIDAVQHLRPCVDDVEPLSPIENGDIGRHFAKCLGQALAALMCNRGDLLWCCSFPLAYSASSFLVKTGETIQKAAVKAASVNVSKECLVMNKSRQGSGSPPLPVPGGGPAKAMASPEGMSRANSSGASGAEIGPAKPRARPSAFFTAAAGSLRTELRRDTMSVHWNALLLSVGSGIASLR